MSLSTEATEALESLRLMMELRDANAVLLVFHDERDVVNWFKYSYRPLGCVDGIGGYTPCLPEWKVASWIVEKGKSLQLRGPMAIAMKEMIERREREESRSFIGPVSHLPVKTGG